jgi:cytochrome c2
VAETTDTRIVESKPEPDPIADKSLSGILLISALVLMLTLIWALYDEIFAMRPWKNVQRRFVTNYSKYLKKLKPNQAKAEKELKESEEYKQLDADMKAAEEAAIPRIKEIDAKVSGLDQQLLAITSAMQEPRSYLAALTYDLEQADEDDKNSYRKEIEDEKNKPRDVVLPTVDGSKPKEQKLSYAQLDSMFGTLKGEKAKLLAERVEVLKTANELRQKRDAYVQDKLIGLSDNQVEGLINKMKVFSYEIKQINVAEAQVVDRCTSCHLAIREPLTITKSTAQAFLFPKRKNREWDKLSQKEREDIMALTTHPNKDLLAEHDVDRFGCSPCHGGNGRATSSVVKGHGRHKYWLWPLYQTENIEAGCQQCHFKDRDLRLANVLNRGKELYQTRGCVGCHRYEGYDRETENLFGARQTIRTLESERTNNLREIDQVTRQADTAASNEEAQRLYARADNLRVTNSQIDAKIDQLNIQARYLMQDQKKIGPNLKEVKVKLKKEWIPVWLENTFGFRPDTKMPNFRLQKDEIQAISAFIWQSGIDGPLPGQRVGQPARQQNGQQNGKQNGKQNGQQNGQQPVQPASSQLGQQPAQSQTGPPQLGDPEKGRLAVESRGCLACHSIGESNERQGSSFATNLSRLGEKANFDYVVRWVHNPRERSRPYCPKEKRDIGPEDYAKKGLPYQFDLEHTKCPNDGAEMQVQQMTVMPNFRLSDQEVRDIATYLTQDPKLNHKDAQYPSAPFMDDPNLKAKGLQLVKAYGCASCHEIAGLEDEGRIGTELTKEGSKPIERLDFGRLEHDFKHDGKYNHKAFFENKLAQPDIYDKGKEKARVDQLKMPKPNLNEEDIKAITTFLLGSVDTTMPASFTYSPADQRKDVQEGMWVIKKYNCMGCHNIQIGQRTNLQELQQYQGDGKEKLPPRLTSEGARVDPRWLLRFLSNPALSQTETDRNGVRSYLQVRMPTFNFSPNELQALVRFFESMSSQAQPYIPIPLEPITDQERDLGRQLFTAKAAPCLKCHLTGDPVRDKSATAPNFLLASERLKPDWTGRWLLDPALIDPGTAMPSGLFERQESRWVLKGFPVPQQHQGYDRDHVQLMVRYMFQLTPEEQRRLQSTSPGGGAAATTTTTTASRRRRGNTVAMARGLIVNH